MIYRIINKIGKIAPYGISSMFVHIPFSFRYGKVYTEFEKKIKESTKWNESQLEEYIVENFNKIFQHAKKMNFYASKYKASGVFDLEIRSIDDIEKIPILHKNEIREAISEFSGDYYQKTGGTTGYPFHFYLDKNAWAREWAHYHAMWRKVGYVHTDAKFILRRSNAKDDFIKYNFEHNDFWINTYKISPENIDEFFKILVSKKVKYLHGYPSAINDFLKEIDKKVTKKQREILQQQIKCCFYSSEYPAPHLVAYLEKEWGLNRLSMYGHSEMCVLAGTDVNGKDYSPFHTYGYAEVVDNMLIGTSYHNFDMPLIRYNTDDLVRPKRYANGILKTFEMKEGRILDFVIDKNDMPIAMVGMFLDRQHEIFKYIDYIQLYQEKKGFVTIVLSHDKGENLDARSLMNLDDIQMEFDFLHLKKPIRTKAGKVPFRVQKLPKK
jgi:phenylacetate-CoA ligase